MLYNGFEVTTIAPNLQYVSVYYINSKGQTAGASVEGGFVNIENSTQLVVFPGSYPSGNEVGGINDSGQVIGDYHASNGYRQAYIFSVSGAFTLINFPGPNAEPQEDGDVLLAENNLGEIAGEASTTVFSNGAYHITYTAFLYVSGSYETLMASSRHIAPHSINSSGEIVGFYETPTGVDQACLFSAGGIQTISPPGATASDAIYVSDQGVVCGNFSDKSGTHGFTYKDGIFTSIDVPGASSTNSVYVSPSGEVVGSYVDHGCSTLDPD